MRLGVAGGRGRALTFVILPAVLIPAVLMPAPARAGLNTAECRRMTSQIERYEGVADMARDRGNDPWEAATQAQINRLADRRVRICPEYAARANALARAAQRSKEFWEMAAKLAIKYFTGGLW